MGGEICEFVQISSLEFQVSRLPNYATASKIFAYFKNIIYFVTLSG